MSIPNKTYIPQDLGELYDFLGWMMLNVPKFPGNAQTAFGPIRTLDTTMFQLREGLGVVRKNLGEERYQSALEMADQMHAFFEADPNAETGDAGRGWDLILKMEEHLKEAWRRKR